MQDRNEEDMMILIVLRENVIRGVLSGNIHSSIQQMMRQICQKCKRQHLRAFLRLDLYEPLLLGIHQWLRHFSCTPVSSSIFETMSEVTLTW